jgi:hypothetical protein
VIIVTEAYVLLIMSPLAASGGWSAAVHTFGLRVRPRVVVPSVLLAGALSVVVRESRPPRSRCGGKREVPPSDTRLV